MEAFAPPVFLEFVRNLLPNPAYIGNTFVPNRTVSDIEYSYIRGTNDVPVMAHVISWDSEAPIARRPGRGEQVFGELPPIKRKSRISEKEIIRFMQPRVGSADQQDAIRTVYADTARLIDSIQARIEWLRLQSISENSVIYNEGDQKIEFDYGIVNAQQINLVTQTDGAGAALPVGKFGPAWTNYANATPVSDLMKLSREMEQRSGERPARFVTSQMTIEHLLQNDQIKNFLYDTNAPRRPLQPGEVQSLFNLYRLPQLIPYDVQVGSENADGTFTMVRCMRENAGVLLPSLPVGNTLFGPTAESRILLGTPYAQLAAGVWASTYAKDEPPSEWSKAVAVAFPTLPNADKIGQMTLWA